MQTRLSTKGQVVLPGQIRNKLGIREGDRLEIGVKDGSIILTPQKKTRPKVKIIIDPSTGLPVLTAGPDAPVLTSEEVAEMLADFP
jgi:AbrB family looped-hinge helix DNA binding protein